MKLYIFVIAILLSAGCSHKSEVPAPVVGTENSATRVVACLDLQDRAISMTVDEYVSENGLNLSDNQKLALRLAWGEELAKNGAMDRFNEACVRALTDERYKCGMSSVDLEGFGKCMNQK